MATAFNLTYFFHKCICLRPICPKLMVSSKIKNFKLDFVVACIINCLYRLEVEHSCTIILILKGGRSTIKDCEFFLQRMAKLQYLKVLLNHPRGNIPLISKAIFYSAD